MEIRHYSVMLPRDAEECHRRWGLQIQYNTGTGLRSALSMCPSKPLGVDVPGEEPGDDVEDEL